MAFSLNSDLNYASMPGSSMFIPCCNVPLAVDSLYQARYYQEIYYAPEPAPQVQVIRQRLPEPPPDVIERVMVVPQPRQYIYQVVEVPSKPPPIIQERVVHQSPQAPVCGGTYQVQVPSNSNAQSPKLMRSSSSVQVSPSPSYVQASPTFVSASPSYVQASPAYIQQASPAFIQHAPTVYTSAPITPF
jgi:hypothetical protein